MAKVQTATAVVENKHGVSEQLQHSLQSLAKVGGFSFLESVVDGLANMNPERKARKQIFLTDKEKQAERKELLQKINLWLQLLDSNSDVETMVDSCKRQSEQAKISLKKNLKHTLSATRELETAYRTVAQFYKNTELDKVQNVHILNASAEQVTDLDNPLFIDAVAAEFKQYYDRLDLRENYSILSMPGYLGSNKVIDK